MKTFQFSTFNSQLNKRGQSLVELLVAIGLAAILLPALITGLVASREGQPQEEKRLAAASLLQETQDAVRNVREKGWTTFAINGAYHPILSGSSWSLAAGNATTSDGFTQSVLIEDVLRDDTGAVVMSGGTLDPSTKKITTTIGWDEPYSSSISNTIYLTRYLDNLTYNQTSHNQFISGTLLSTQATTTTDGEVILAANIKGQWCTPEISSSTINLDDLPIAVTSTEGHIYVATGQTSNPGQVSFEHVLVSTGDPPTGAIHGKLLGYQTNGVFGEPDYGYIATTHDTKEVVIANLNQFSDPINKIYQEAGYFDARVSAGTNSTANANAIYVFENRGYVAAGQYLYVFDLSSKSGSRPRIGSRIQFANTSASEDKAGGLYVRRVGNNIYAYISVEGSHTDELEIAIVTNENISSQWRLLTQTSGGDESDGKLNIEPNNCSTLESGKSIFVNPDGDRAYVSSVNDAAFKEFFVIDTDNKSNPSLIGGFATQPTCTNGGGYEAAGMDPEGSVVVSLAENRALLVGTDPSASTPDAEEYQVLNLSNEASPARCGGLQLNQGIFGVAAVKETDGDAYAYIITGDGNAELKIIQGGPDGAYAESGTYESAIYDAGYSTTFNRFTATTTIPANTNVEFQFAVADPVNGSCNNASYNYTGPGGSGSTYYTATGEPLALDDNGSGYENPGRCFRYKAFLSTTDYNTTPILHDITVNYSP